MLQLPRLLTVMMNSPVRVLHTTMLVVRVIVLMRFLYRAIGFLVCLPLLLQTCLNGLTHETDDPDAHKHVEKNILHALDLMQLLPLEQTRICTVTIRFPFQI
jgi:hypothetical protein